jgi:NAD(P)-dependent dehydrogenase (short-subunit alcohol dehydrogenase family)
MFRGNSVLVTGGAGGLGEAVVRRLHGNGLSVVIADIGDEKGRTLADELGQSATFVHTDVTDDDSVAAAIECAGSARCAMR